MQTYDDHFPGGDKLGRDPSHILDSLVSGCRLDAWVFCHFNSSTAQMLRRFRSLLGAQRPAGSSSASVRDLSASDATTTQAR